ncbi:MAG: quinolinate synthase NadA [Bacteroidales bacterium]|nr:quinolinate synthase NadA [Bacteroidales bacterium]
MLNKIEEIKKNGFINIDENEKTDLIKEINLLKKEKNAVILAHYYVDGAIQDISDFVGDSLALSQKAATTNADIILFVGVHFMAETAKILSPDKKVILPDLNAGCSLADSCPDVDFEEFIKQHPNHVVVSYVNTTAKVKALTDIVCTSSNAKKIIESIPKDKKIIFGPDKNLGNHISRITGREMVIWDGACHVHNEFSLEGILEQKKQNPDAKIISHPECPKQITMISDYVGSTSGLINFTKEDNAKTFIVATEPGVIHEMKKASPNKFFIPAPGEDSECACSECEFMKLNNIKKVYSCLKYELPEIKVDEDIRKKAYIPIKAMLDLSN